MKIGIDVSIEQINQAGTAIYVSSLVKALQEFDKESIYVPFSVDHSHDMSKPKSLRSRLDTLYRDIIWTHVTLPWQVARTGVDLLHMPANVVPLQTPCKVVVSILDGIIFQTPEKFPLWHRTYARFFVPMAARKASKILTISEQSKRDLVKHLHLSPEKIVVTPLAASSDFRPIEKAEIEAVRRQYDLRTFILTVGTLEPRKNIIRLLQAFAKLRERGFTGLLVHVGPKGWLYDDILAEVNRLQLEQAVRFLGRVPLKDLVGLYNAASSFVYPSLYEGFGLPVLEAMACACPVITSNVSSLPEVAADAAIMVDPYNVQDLVDAMTRIWTDPAYARELRERGIKQSKLFSWERCARETLSVYKQVLNS